MSVDTSTLQSDIVTDLTAELSGEASFDADLLAAKVKAAVLDVQRRRNYGKSSYTDDEIASDLENYYINIRNVALYDYNQIGFEFQTASNENGANRSYMNRETLFVGVAPFVG